MIPKNFAGIVILADMNCTCTPDQQTGKDFTFCNSCKAASILNYIEEIKRNCVEDMFGRKI